MTVLFLVGTGDFGPGYDELIGDFQYGERSLFFLATGDWRYLQFERSPPADILHPGHADLALQALRYSDHGEAAAIVSAATCALLFRGLGWLPAVEAHHAANWLFAVLLVTVLYRAVRGVLGTRAALWAVVALLAQPRLLAHFFFNIKDFPEAVLFALVVLCFWHGWTQRRPALVIATGLISGVAFVVKANALFLPAILLPWAWYHQRTVKRLGGTARLTSRGSATLGQANPDIQRHSGSLRFALVLMPLAALVGFYATWPYLWTDPTGAAWRYIEFLWNRSQSGQPGALLAALRAWLTATPEIVLAGAVAGCVFWFRDRRVPTAGVPHVAGPPLSLTTNAGRQAARGMQRSFLVLAMLWLAVPLVRANLPGMQYHDGIRLFLEVTVPTAVLAGWGIDRTLGAIAGPVGQVNRGTRVPVGAASASKQTNPRPGTRFPTATRWILAAMAGAAILVVATYEPARVYPYELAYFNRLSGGLAGAWQRGDPDATDYWGASYRQGIRWLNENLPRESVVAVPFADHLVRYTRAAPSGLRHDLTLLEVSSPYDSANVHKSIYLRALEGGPVTVMFVTRRSWYNAVIRHAQAHGRLLYSLRVDDVPILEIRRVPATRE